MKLGMGPSNEICSIQHAICQDQRLSVLPIVFLRRHVSRGSWIERPERQPKQLRGRFEICRYTFSG